MNACTNVHECYSSPRCTFVLSVNWQCLCSYHYSPLPLPPPPPVIAQDDEVLEGTGRKRYVDPSTYPSVDEAVRDFAKEISPKSLRIIDEIGRGNLDRHVYTIIITLFD